MKCKRVSPKAPQQLRSSSSPTCREFSKKLREGVCNGRGSLTPDSEPRIRTRAWGRGRIKTSRGEMDGKTWTGKARTWNGQGRDVERTGVTGTVANGQGRLWLTITSCNFNLLRLALQAICAPPRHTTPVGLPSFPCCVKKKHARQTTAHPYIP